VRESAFTKAERYLLSGRLTVERVVGDVVLVRVVGDEGDSYVVSLYPQGRTWSCSCPALWSRCSHVQALARVVRKP
jgi:uncharacterized Zn finger protein